MYVNDDGRDNGLGIWPLVAAVVGAGASLYSQAKQKKDAEKAAEKEKKKAKKEAATSAAVPVPEVKEKPSGMAGLMDNKLLLIGGAVLLTMLIVKRR